MKKLKLTWKLTAWATIGITALAGVVLFGQRPKLRRLLGRAHERSSVLFPVNEMRGAPITTS